MSALLNDLSVPALITAVCFLIGIAIEHALPGPIRPTQRTTVLNALHAMAYIVIQTGAMVPFRASLILLVGALGARPFELPDSGPGLVGSALLFLLAMDFGEYAFHRLQHAWAPLWRLHALHHSDPDMNVTTVYRHPWPDLFIKTILIVPVVALFLKPGINAQAIYALIALFNYFTHMSTRLSLGPFWFVLNNPRYHRVHHSIDPADHGWNYAALLPLFDLVFGTARRPDPDRHPQTGVAELEAPTSLVAMLSWPLLAVPRSARGVVQDDAERVAFAGPNPADAVAQPRPVPAPAAL
ncbi:MAG TPA: sterol desaturase family protein [Aliidongia sp.]|nr:sterol desaturase family protein [Aliidongia sp.]